jgi:hypothetical protein
MLVPSASRMAGGPLRRLATRIHRMSPRPAERGAQRGSALGRSFRWPAAAALAAALLAGACSLDEVSIPTGDDTLVVEAVLRTDRQEQLVLLHRSLRGNVDPGEDSAIVRLRRDDGLELQLNTAPEGACTFVDPAYVASDSLDVQVTCYTTEGAGPALPPGRIPPPFVLPSRTYDLYVRTARGEVVQGRTRVPGTFALTGGLRPGYPLPDQSACVLPPDTNFTVTWTQSDSSWSYLSRIEIPHLNEAFRAHGDSVQVRDPFELLGLAVSRADTTVVLPREFGVFDRFTTNLDVLRLLQRGLPAGVRVSLTVAAADRNYVNAVRGGRFNPSGQARVSSVVGDGVGVFGSLVPLQATVDVRQLNPRDNPCLP